MCSSDADFCADAEIHVGISAQIAASKIAGFVMVALNYSCFLTKVITPDTSARALGAFAKAG
jgi:hypothetical protein